jgi:hypothetical protein
MKRNKTFTYTFLHTHLIQKDGQVLRIRPLCSNASDANEKIQQFFKRVRHSGHSEKSLKPIFSQAKENALKYINSTAEEQARHTKQKLMDAQKQIYFHLQGLEYRERR